MGDAQRAGRGIKKKSRAGNGREGEGARDKGDERRVIVTHEVLECRGWTYLER